MKNGKINFFQISSSAGTNFGSAGTNRVHWTVCSSTVTKWHFDIFLLLFEHKNFNLAQKVIFGQKSVFNEQKFSFFVKIAKLAVLEQI